MLTRIRQFWRACGGSTAEELALIAPVFILLMLITIELGYMLFTYSVLDGGARTAARLVRTGQVQTKASPLSTFTTALCDNVSSVIPCASIATDVESFANFSTMSPAALTRDKTGKVTNNAFVPGGPNAAVAVRVAYTYHFMVPWVDSILDSGGNGVVLLSTVVFKNEPYPTAP